MNIIKKTTAFIFALLFVAGAPAVVPVGFSVSNSAILAEAASCFSFDSATGTLTLKGNIIAEEVRAFQKESNLSVKAIIAAPGSVLPSNCSNLFSTFTAAETIDLSKANSQNVTDMTAMFYNCFNATSINVKGFDTSNVTSMPKTSRN